MIDLHGHYLPWVDDGPGCLDEALLMLRMAEADGIRFAVLTPTIDPRHAPVPYGEIAKKFAAFAQLVRRRGLGLRLRLGAELIHGPGAIEAIDRRQLPFIGEWEGRRVALLRWAEDFIPIGAISATQDMIARGVLPMLAHPERNPGVVRAPSTLELFLCDGCLVQVDAGSVLGWHGPEVRDTAFRLIEAGMVTVLATGAADAVDRPPMLRAARDIVAQRFGEEIAVRLTELNPSLVVAGDLARPPADGVAPPVDLARAAAPVLAEATAPAPAGVRPLGAFGIRGEVRDSGIPVRGALPALPGSGDSGGRRRRSLRRAEEPVIAPADPEVPLMRF